MATSSRTGTARKPARPAQRKSSTPMQDRRNARKKDKKESRFKRVWAYLLVVGLLFVGFYAFQYIQMERAKASIAAQIADAKKSDASDKKALTATLEEVRVKFPGADAFTSDDVFQKPPMAGRVEDRIEYIHDEGEKSIKEARDRAPMLFLTDIIMPGAQKSTDDNYRAQLLAHTNSTEFKEFNDLKLRVDDLMAGVNYCHGEITDLTYGYTDPVPSSDVKAARSTVIQDAARRHLCPEKS